MLGKHPAFITEIRTTATGMLRIGCKRRQRQKHREGDLECNSFGLFHNAECNTDCLLTPYRNPLLEYWHLPARAASSESALTLNRNRALNTQWVFNRYGCPDQNER